MASGPVQRLEHGDHTWTVVLLHEPGASTVTTALGVDLGANRDGGHDGGNDIARTLLAEGVRDGSTATLVELTRSRGGTSRSEKELDAFWIVDELPASEHALATWLLRQRLSLLVKPSALARATKAAQRRSFASTDDDLHHEVLRLVFQGYAPFKAGGIKAVAPPDAGNGETAAEQARYQKTVQDAVRHAVIVVKGGFEPERVVDELRTALEATESDASVQPKSAPPLPEQIAQRMETVDTGTQYATEIRFAWPIGKEAQPPWPELEATAALLAGRVRRRLVLGEGWALSADAKMEPYAGADVLSLRVQLLPTADRERARRATIEEIARIAEEPAPPTVVTSAWAEAKLRHQLNGGSATSIGRRVLAQDQRRRWHAAPEAVVPDPAWPADATDAETLRAHAERYLGPLTRSVVIAPTSFVPPEEEDDDGEAVAAPSQGAPASASQGSSAPVSASPKTTPKKKAPEPSKKTGPRQSTAGKQKAP